MILVLGPLGLPKPPSVVRVLMGIGFPSHSCLAIRQSNSAERITLTVLLNVDHYDYFKEVEISFWPRSPQLKPRKATKPPQESKLFILEGSSTSRNLGLLKVWKVFFMNCSLRIS